MRSGPSGPRSRQPTHPNATGQVGGRPGAARPAADRDQVFASIFGRQAAGHHAASGRPTGYEQPQGHAYASHNPGMMPSGGSGYEQFAPPMPPGMGPAYNRPPAGSDYSREGSRDAYGGPPGQLPQDYARDRRQSFTPSIAPSVAPSMASSSNYVVGLPGPSGPTPHGFTSSRQPMNPYAQPAPIDTQTRSNYVPGPYPPERARSTSTQSGVVGGRPQPDGPRANGNYTSQTLPNNRRGAGLTPAQSYRLQESDYGNGGLSSPTSIYEERFESPAAMTPNPQQPSWSAPTQPLNLRSRPSSGASGSNAGAFEDETVRHDMPPPPDYSTTDPALLARRRTGPSAGTTRPNPDGPPRLPDVISDVKNMRLFDNDDSSNRNSKQSGDWSFLAGYTDDANIENSRRLPSQVDGHHALPTIPGSRNVSGTSTVRDSRGESMHGGSEADNNRSRYSRDDGFGSSGYASPISATTHDSGRYADELRDRVHPVVRQDPYARHRRQASDTSIVSVSTVHSGYGTGPRNSQTYLPHIDTSSRQYGERGSPVMSSPGTLAGDNPFQLPGPPRLSGRPSSESIQSLPHGHRTSYGSGVDIRSTSFSGPSMQREAAVTAIRTGSLGHGNRVRSQMPLSTISHPSPNSSLTNVAIHAKRPSQHQVVRRTPTIHPAFISRVAEIFRQVLALGDRLKDGLSYSDAFDGREAVDLLCDIIRTSDRNLALLLGRALDSQRFFHDVTYAHRLRDSTHEIYRFKQLLPSPFAGPEGATVDGRPASRPTSKGYSSGSITALTAMSSGTSSPLATTPGQTPATSTTTVNQLSETGRPRRVSDASSEDSLPVGVFTLLTDCYSPTCSRDSLCYSINCPRRLEVQKRLNMKIEPGLNTEIAEDVLLDTKETGTLWIQSVPQDVIDSVDDTEKKRQEAINELIYTERDFVRDMEYLRDQWIKPLRTQDVVPAARREEFVQQVFWNTHEILSVNTVLAEKLTKRQKQAHVVPRIGDILLEQVQRFEPFVTYGAHQLFGKYEFEKEKGSNPGFQKFVDETERDPSSRKLELNGYLTKPTTRLARYPLLLEVIAKYTPEGNSDKEDLVEAVKIVREFLTRVNKESGKSENLFNLAQLDQQLIFRPGENFDLHLRDKNRELVYKGPLKCRGGPNAENADLLVFLFDHALLMVKPKWVNKHEQYKVYRKPIPLELLVATSPEDINIKGSISRGKATAARPPGTKGPKDPIPKADSKHGYSLTLIHLGRKGYTMTLWCPTYAGRKKWLENIDAQQAALRDRSKIFDTVSLTDRFFIGVNKLNCAVPYDRGNRMIYGTDDGVYFSNHRDERLRHPTKVISMPDVTQVDVLEEFQLLVVLSERSVTAFPLEFLDPTDTSAALKRGKRLSSHTSFFKSGICLGRTLLCIVKSSSLSSTIKTLEPVDQSMRGKKQPTPFRKLLNNSNEPFKVFKEFYIPTESSGLSFLKTKLCVATTRGFEVVDLETLDTQGLLDPSDSSLDFVSKRENVRPVAIYRVEENFLLCYAEFAFYVNKTGWRARPRWAIQWEGFPTAFAMHYPFILAFEPTFIEVRHVETGNLVQIVTGSNIRCLFSDTPPSHIHTANQYRTGMPGYPYGQAPPPHAQGYPYGPGGGHPAHMPPPPAPQPPANRLQRNQIIFVSDDGNVQVVRLNREYLPGMMPPGGAALMPATSMSRR